MTGSSVAEDIVRSTAQARAAVLGLPTPALEDWRYVRCTTLADAAYAAPRAPTAAELAPWSALPAVLVLVDGVVVHRALPSWLTEVDSGDDAAAATALAAETDHAAVWAAAGATRLALRVANGADQPLHIVNFATGGTGGWTITLDVAAGARFGVVLRHVALGAARSCPALTVRAARGAQVAISEIQATEWHHLLGVATVTAEADATVRWTSVARGGACVRLATRATLAGRGAHVELNGLAEVRGSDQAHHHLRVTHAAGDSTSEQLFKAVLHDRTQVGFDGLVRILPGCDGADAQQQDRNLVLSDQARADTRPQLDIQADDVKAAHGATVGQLDADELLYLRCRGISLELARTLLVTGFGGEVLARLTHPEAL